MTEAARRGSAIPALFDQLGDEKMFADELSALLVILEEHVARVTEEL